MDDAVEADGLDIAEELAEEKIPRSPDLCAVLQKVRGVAVDIEDHVALDEPDHRIQICRKVV